MKKRNNYFKLGYWIFACAVLLTGCSKEHSTEERIVVEDVKEEMGEEKKERQEMESGNVSLEENTKDTEDDTEDMEVEPEIAHADWSEYFNGLNGTAVIYDASNRRYTIYNDELAETRRSPCSTFKIISSLTALEQGILDPEDSTRTWSGEVFWNEDWNRDIDFSEAFRTSCVWYYRQLIDDIGQDRMQEELEKLQYGNCDISDWEGRLNTNNNNRVLTGFWLESSLLISPKEQTEVMERIFGENSEYSEETQNDLKQVMLVTEQEQTDILLYGKTGMGKAEGIVVDAWFTGFAETTEGNLYFCVRLGRTDGMNVSSPLAKEIAIKLVSYYNR
jgi:bla regulator protein BlaR1